MQIIIENLLGFYTNQEWGNVTNYHISVDSSALGIDDTAKIICDFVKLRFGIK